MKTPTVYAAFVLSLLLLSFTPPGSSTPPALRTGTYGVCGCGTSTATGPDISLALHDDHTFHYVNGTDPNEPMDITGNWELEGNKVTLRTAGTDDKVFETWTLDKNATCLRSREGLLFTRLCHMEACQ